MSTCNSDSGEAPRAEFEVGDAEGGVGSEYRLIQITVEGEVQITGETVVAPQESKSE